MLETVEAFMGKRNGILTVSILNSFTNVIGNLKKANPKCQTPNLTEEEIKLKFIEAYNLTMKEKRTNSRWIQMK